MPRMAAHGLGPAASMTPSLNTMLAKVKRGLEKQSVTVSECWCARSQVAASRAASCSACRGWVMQELSVLPQGHLQEGYDKARAGHCDRGLT